MSRYKHFDEELTGVDGQNAPVLPSLDVDESIQVENDSTQFQIRNGRRKLIFDVFSRFVRKRTTLENFLLPLVLILLILVFVKAFFSSTRRSQSEEICLSPSCVDLSSSINKGLNKSVDPCEDFYEFVCGKWIKTNVIPKGQSSWSTSKELSRKNLILLKTILEQTPIETNSNEFNAENEAIKFYRSCLNTSEIDRRAIEPLKLFLKTFLNWTVEQWIEIDQNRTHAEFFVDLTRILAAKFGFSYFFTVTVGADEKNSSWNTIHIHQPQLGLESRDFYLNSSSNDRNKIIRETYRNVSVEFLGLLGFSRSQAQQRFDDLFQYESELAKIILPMETLQKPNETYDVMSLKELNLLFKSIDFDFKFLLDEIFKFNSSNPIEFNDEDRLIVLSVDLMNKMSTFISDHLLSTSKSHVVIDHIIFSLIFDLSLFLSSDFQKVSLPLVKELSGADSLPERWEYCVTETDATFGYSLGSLYVNSVFGDDDRRKAKEIIETIRETFDENLAHSNWIDESSKSEAKKKLTKIKEKIGYPDFIRNRTVLNQRYFGFTMNEDDFFFNKIKSFQRDRRRSLSNLRQKVDLTEWSMTPRVVNAYYTPSANEIVFPAGILQLPFFHRDLPSSLNYGAIGTVIGHEITNGFDDQGREYDADGNMRSWWSKSALAKFEERSKCFVKQYSAFSVDGQSENGQRTLSENIADNGGMKLSFLAYQKNKKRSKSNASNLRLPGLPYTNDQLFFIGFAHSWCSLENANALYVDLISDPHSPAKFRILGTIANSEAFAQTFSCSPSSRMNPSQKCQLW